MKYSTTWQWSKSDTSSIIQVHSFYARENGGLGWFLAAENKLFVKIEQWEPV